MRLFRAAYTLGSTSPKSSISMVIMATSSTKRRLGSGTPERQSILKKYRITERLIKAFVITMVASSFFGFSSSVAISEPWRGLRCFMLLRSSAESENNATSVPLIMAEQKSSNIMPVKPVTRL